MTDSAAIWRAHVAKVGTINPCRRRGVLEASVGSTLLARLPGARTGEVVLVGRRRRPAEIIGFRGSQAILLPWGGRDDLGAGMPVVASSRSLDVAFSPALLGRILDARGQAQDGRSLPPARLRLPLVNSSPAPLSRRPIRDQMATGVRAIDGLVSIGVGQRVGLFAGPGQGKSTLLMQIARHGCADCCVICLIGERGREVQEFLVNGLPPEVRDRSVLVCCPADAPAGERARALEVATTLAEGFRASGQHVLLLVDSLTRHVRALREIALSAGELPGRRGFPPMVFERMTALLERSGCDANGAITAVYTVLTEERAEDDPLAEEVRGVLDGHICLSDVLARQACFPAIDPLRSMSRVMGDLVSPEHRMAAARFRELWSAHEERRDLIAAGAYLAGSEPLTDEAIAKRPAMMAFLRQDFRKSAAWAETCSSLIDLTAGNTPDDR